AFIYAKDEPSPEELPEVREFARLVRRADRDLRVLVTASLDPSLEGLTGIWSPNINCLFDRPLATYCTSTVPLTKYGKARKSGARMWWYQSCGSHGCGEQEALDASARRYFRGWPSYMVDHDGPLNRAMGALAYRHGIEGELYFNTVEAYHDGKGGRGDPWKSVRRFAGNGDGTLFYPGTPERIGGKTHVPVESLRLKHIRDGLEDYELLTLARSVGLQKEADALASSLAPQPFEITRDWRKWEDGRRKLLQAVAARARTAGEFPRGPAVTAPLK
ncbi:MAG: DUF4091 domain-containing protein, partial [Myxococcales bacterium]